MGRKLYYEREHLSDRETLIFSVKRNANNKYRDGSFLPIKVMKARNISIRESRGFFSNGISCDCDRSPISDEIFQEMLKGRNTEYEIAELEIRLSREPAIFIDIAPYGSKVGVPEERVELPLCECMLLDLQIGAEGNQLESLSIESGFTHTSRLHRVIALHIRHSNNRTDVLDEPELIDLDYTGES